MTELELTKYREKFGYLKQEKDLLIKEYEELQELLKDEKVQRYIELIDNDYSIPKDEELAERAFSCNVQSNKIMVYMGTYIYDIANDYITYDNDPEGMFKAYLDLDTREAYNIVIEDCKKFEERNLVIYLPVEQYNSHEYTKNYFALRRWYLLQLINNHQEIVLDQLKKLNEMKHKQLYLATHKYPPVQLTNNATNYSEQFDAESFAKNFPANGFIESYCLTSEERKLVRLHRKEKNSD